MCHRLLEIPAAPRMTPGGTATGMSAGGVTAPGRASGGNADLKEDRYEQPPGSAIALGQPLRCHRRPAGPLSVPTHKGGSLGAPPGDLPVAVCPGVILGTEGGPQRGGGTARRSCRSGGAPRGPPKSRSSLTDPSSGGKPSRGPPCGLSDPRNSPRGVGASRGLSRGGGTQRGPTRGDGDPRGCPKATAFAGAVPGRQRFQGLDRDVVKIATSSNPPT
ncbi:translation initiation factor IF-2-like [Homarus americanus]|uniref:translation initiation factor IF-2-like n=1 Tax=Homarus americanus TaxID=6706 RepID=UPI001C43C068|nr:translation initiation factor IF-2-like [Homarus americanus]